MRFPLALLALIVSFNHSDLPRQFVTSGSERPQLIVSGRQVQDIRETAKPMKPRVGILPFFAVAVSAAILLIIPGLYSRRSKYVGTQIRRGNAYEDARKAVMSLKGRNIGKRNHCIELSQIIRQYLEAGFGFQSASMTTAEILAKAQGTEGIKGERVKFLTDLLILCDLVIYAEYEPKEAEVGMCFRLAGLFIENTGSNRTRTAGL